MSARGRAEIEIRDIQPTDAGEVLTLQRASFVSEARLYGDPDMAVMTQTLEQVEAELQDNLGVVAVDQGRMVGAARAQKSGDVLLIGRIAVAPDQQGEGIGTMLLSGLEERGRAAGCVEAELFTGSESTANLELYRREGYKESERIEQGDGTAQVFLRKRLGR